MLFRDYSARVYCIYGGSNEFNKTIDLNKFIDNPNNDIGFVIEGLETTNIFVSKTIDFVDFNGDSIADIAIGDYTGKLYILYGENNFNLGKINIQSYLNGINGFIITYGSSDHEFGGGLSNIKSINGDMYEDLIVVHVLLMKMLTNPGNVS